MTVCRLLSIVFAALVVAVVAAPPAFAVAGGFVVADGTSGVLRYDAAGDADPAPGRSGASFARGGVGGTTGLAYPDALDEVWVAGRFGDLAGYAAGDGVANGVAIGNLGPVSGLAVGEDGAVYLGDLESGDILRFCGRASLCGALGAPWPAPGQDGAVFAQAGAVHDMVVGPDSNLYVTTGGSDIERFSGRTGVPLPAAGAPPGSAIFAAQPGAQLRGLAFEPSGRLDVADGAAHAIRAFCGPLGNGCAPGSGGDMLVGPTIAGVTLQDPDGLDVAPDGAVYVADAGAARVVRFTFDPFSGRPHPVVLVAPSAGGLTRPGLLKLERRQDVGGALVRDWLAIGDVSRVEVFDRSSGAPLGPLGGVTPFTYDTGSAVQGVTALAVGPDDRLYASAAGFSEVRACAPGQVGGIPCPPLAGTSAFGEARSLAFGPDGRLYVAFANGIESADTARPDFPDWRPAVSPEVAGAAQVAWGPDGNLYVSTAAGIFRYDGRTRAPLDRLVGTGQPVAPVFTFGRDGSLYAYGIGGPGLERSEIDRIDITSGDQFPFVAVDSGGLSRDGVAALTFGPDDNLYVLNGDGAVLRYDGATGAPLPGPGQPAGSAAFLAPGAGGLDHRPRAIVFPPVAHTVRVEGLVGTDFHGDFLPVGGATVTAEEAFPGTTLLSCPFAGLFFAPCPTNENPNPGASPAFALSLVAGQWVLKAFPPAGADLFPGALTVHVDGGTDLTDLKLWLVAPEPVPAGTDVLPGPGSLTTIPTVEGMPVLHWRQGFRLRTDACPGGEVSYALSAPDGTQITAGALAEGPAGRYTADVAAPVMAATPVSGLVRVHLDVDCPGGGGAPEEFLLYIDPSGRVLDDATGSSIPGARVTLLRAPAAGAAFSAVPEGSAVMALSNRANPDTTDADGAFGWDVQPGQYELQAWAPGYTCAGRTLPAGLRCAGDAVATGPIAIPPAAIDLALPLHRSGGSEGPAARVGVAPPSASAGSGAAHAPRLSLLGGLRARRSGHGWLMSGRLRLDAPARLRVRVLDARARPLLLQRGSRLGGAQLRRPSHAASATARAGRVTLLLRVRAVPRRLDVLADGPPGTAPARLVAAVSRRHARRRRGARGQSSSAISAAARRAAPGSGSR